MINVLIVDDEKLVRMAMRNIINWEEHGAKVIGYAKDGNEALNIIKKEEIDLIITDLKMPGMDGIALIKEVKQKFSNINIVVLSNHGDFELVKEAMKKGAMDYLLKITIEKEDIEVILNQLKESIENQIYEIDNSSIKIKQNESFSIENLNFKNKEMNKYIMSYISIKSKESTSDLKKLHLNVEAIINDTLEGKVEHKILVRSDNEFIIVLEYDSEILYKALISNIKKNIKQYLNKDAVAILSLSYITKNDLGITLKKAMSYIEWSFYFENQVLILNELGDLSPLDYSNMDYHSRILRESKRKNVQGVIEILSEALDYMRDNSINTLGVKSFLKFIFENIKGQNLEYGTKNCYKIDEIINEFENVSSFNEVLKLVKESEDILKDFINLNNNKYRKEIDDVIFFIDRNIENRISLGMLAKAVNMNESYLSRIFKSETGKNLMFYINEKKMERALELLNDKNIMVKEVAVKVGIDDQFYFNKLFKKFHNLSPSDFRKKKCL